VADLPFNFIDLAAIVVVVVGVVMGIRSGFVVQALALAGFVAGIVILILLGPEAAGLLADFEPPLRALLALGGMAAVVLLAQSLGGALGGSLRSRMGRGVLGSLDSGAGAVFGFARGVFIVWLVGGLLAALPFSVLASAARESVVLRALDTRLPSPVILAAELGQLIQATGLPDVFAGAPPPPAAPVDAPEMAEAQAIAAAGLVSTLRVEALACGRFMTGSGFAVERSHLLTNAHVVAGTNRVQVSFDGAIERYQGVLVHFDPLLDVAVVYVPDLELDALPLAGGPPSRGETAAAIGFTGGGSQRVVPAAINRALEAVGRDIYGRRTVTRSIIEMTADVAPGDSGGPVLLSDGSVGGVTFSESRENSEIGYALSPLAVADSIEFALGNTRPVSSGDCLP